MGGGGGGGGGASPSPSPTPSHARQTACLVYDAKVESGGGGQEFDLAGAGCVCIAELLRSLLACLLSTCYLVAPPRVATHAAGL